MVKIRPFITAKTIDMYDHPKPTLRDFNPGLFIIHADANNLPLNKTSNKIAEEIVTIAESAKKKQLKRFNFRHRNPFKHCNFRHGYKTKADEVNKILEEICGKKGIPLIRNNNINSKRHLNRTRLHLMTLRSQFWLGTLKLF